MDFQSVYDKMQADQQDQSVIQQKKEEEDKRPFFMKLLNIGGVDEPGSNNLFNQPPWCLYRVHHKVSIFGQIAKMEIENGKKEKKGNKKLGEGGHKNESGKENISFTEYIEEPSFWKLTGKIKFGFDGMLGGNGKAWGEIIRIQGEIEGLFVGIKYSKNKLCSKKQRL